MRKYTCAARAAGTMALLARPDDAKGKIKSRNRKNTRENQNKDPLNPVPAYGSHGEKGAEAGR